MAGNSRIRVPACGATPQFHRRHILTGIAGGAALLVAGRAAKAACAVTPSQSEGPFYPLTVEDHDWDLTRVSGGTGRAEGEVVEVTGQVLDAGCRPMPGAVVELWQANVHGRYDHPADRSNGRPLDPNFQGYARLATDDRGSYRFRTIVPGSYPASRNWMRPPHIHFRVFAPSGRSVTTQMYFAGDPLNDKDLLLAPLSREQRASLEVPFDTVRSDGVRAGVFNLTIA